MKNSTKFFCFQIQILFPCFSFFRFLIVHTECQTKNNKCNLHKEKKKRRKNKHPLGILFPKISTIRFHDSQQKQEATSLIESYCSQIRLFHGAKIIENDWMEASRDLRAFEPFEQSGHQPTSISPSQGQCIVQLVLHKSSHKIRIY